MDGLDRRTARRNRVDDEGGVSVILGHGPVFENLTGVVLDGDDANEVGVERNERFGTDFRGRNIASVVRSDTTCDITPASGWPSCVSHCGLSVETTNKQASATVAAWEKISQSLRIGDVS